MSPNRLLDLSYRVLRLKLCFEGCVKIAFPFAPRREEQTQLWFPKDKFVQQVDAMDALLLNASAATTSAGGISLKLCHVPNFHVPRSKNNFRLCLFAGGFLPQGQKCS